MKKKKGIAAAKKVNEMPGLTVFMPPPLPPAKPAVS
jgi:hypothetical protein